MIFARAQNTPPPEKVYEHKAAKPLPDLVDRVPRRTAGEFKDDLLRLTAQMAEAYDTGQYAAAERASVRLGFLIASHHRDTHARNVFAALKFIQRGETPRPLGDATSQAV